MAKQAAAKAGHLRCPADLTSSSLSRPKFDCFPCEVQPSVKTLVAPFAGTYIGCWRFRNRWWLHGKNLSSRQTTALRWSSEHESAKWK